MPVRLLADGPSVRTRCERVQASFSQESECTLFHGDQNRVSFHRGPFTFLSRDMKIDITRKRVDYSSFWPVTAMRTRSMPASRPASRTETIVP